MRVRRSASMWMLFVTLLAASGAGIHTGGGARPFDQDMISMTGLTSQLAIKDGASSLYIDRLIGFIFIGAVTFRYEPERRCGRQSQKAEHDGEVELLE